MGAPNTAYFNNGNLLAETHKVAVATRELLFPIFTAAYSTPAAFKEKFYCDYLLEFLTMKDPGGNIHTTMVAAVIVNGNNVGMHADNRFSNIELSVKHVDGSIIKVVVLNDGGLNTKGTSEIASTLSTVFSAYTLQFTFKSAFYLNSSAYGFSYRWRNDDDTAWDGWNIVDLQPANLSVTAGETKSFDEVVPIKRPVTHLILAQVKPFLTNSEGIYEGSIITLFPTLKSIQLQLNIWTNNPSTYYINDDIIVAGGNESSLTGLWNNADMSGGRITSTLELWKDSRYYYTYGYDTVNDIWCFLSLVDSDQPDPDPTYSTYDFVFFTTNIGLTAEEISDIMMSSPTGPGWMTGTVYNPLAPSPNTDKWYTTNSLSTLVPNGWYVQGNYAVGVNKALKIIGGEVIEEYDN